MTKQEAIKAYTEKFGSYPSFLFMGATDNYIIKTIEAALKSGEAIKSKSGRIY